MKKRLGTILFIIYFLVAIIITHELLSYNKYNIIEYKNSYIVTLNDDSLYKKSDLLIIKKNEDIKVKDNVVYYEIYSSKVSIKSSSIKKIENGNIVLENDKIISKDNILGTEKNIKSFPCLGTIHNILVSTWGYLFIIIFPMFAAFVYEIFAITKEIGKKWNQRKN